MKVLVKSPFTAYSGYGSDGIGLVQALMRYGCDVYLQPTHIDPPLPQDVANLLTKELKAPFDLLINHIDPSLLDCNDETAASVDVSVGWTMWEYSNLGNLAKPARKTLKKRLKNFDALLGYSDIDMDCFRPYYKGAMSVLQGGFDPSLWPYLEDRDWNCREFRFCMLGVLSERKDPFRCIEAFTNARAQDEEFRRWARLSLKTTAPGLHHKIEDLFRDNDPETGEEYTALRVFYDIWPTDLVREFYRVQHVLVSPSRGEGKNVPALEFLSSGGSVIATNWAGHTQWLSREYSFPLDYHLAPVNTDSPDTYNARASVDHLTELMLYAFHHRDEVREMGRIGSEVIPLGHSWDAVVEKMFLRLKDILPAEKGERLWTLAQMARRDGDQQDR